MTRKQTTEYEQWERIAAKINEVEAELFALLRLLNATEPAEKPYEWRRENGVPKTVYNAQFTRAERGLSELKSDLESRVSAEHPEKWEIGLFYGRNNPEADDTPEDDD